MKKKWLLSVIVMIVVWIIIAVIKRDYDSLDLLVVSIFAYSLTFFVLNRYEK